MTLEQAKLLVPEKDYVVHLGGIFLFNSFEPHHPDKPHTTLPSRIRIKYLDGDKVRMPPFENCQTLGEYRGCFSKDIFPPKSQEDERFSIDVFTTDGNLYNVGFYNYEESKWCWHTDTLVEQENFVWCFPPDYLKI